MRKMFIWGAGDIGKRIINKLDINWIEAFVESDNAKVGSIYCGKKVIAIEEYIQNYSDYYIIVAQANAIDAIRILENNNIKNYFSIGELPGELVEPYNRDYLKNFIISYFKDKENYILYGFSLYTILIDAWIFDEYKIHPPIAINEEERKIDSVKKCFPELNLKEDFTIFSVNEVCVCVDEYNQLSNLQCCKNINLVDLYDCTDKICDYYNSEVAKLHNIHNGKRCFIVATGPSLKSEDLDILKNNDEICFSVNKIYHIFNETLWRPTYYVVADWRMQETLISDNPVLDGMDIFVADTSAKFWSEHLFKNIYKFHQHYEYCSERLPKFTDDFSRKSYTGSTITYTCIQLAAYMGFSEIYLIGVDFSYAKNGGKYEHFYKEENLSSLGFHKYVANAYLAAKIYAEKNNIKIYNATRGGNLEIFERVDFDSLFY